MAPIATYGPDSADRRISRRCGFDWVGSALPQRPYNPIVAFTILVLGLLGGQMTNLAAHSLDILHWYLGVNGPEAVVSSGGRYALEDNGETPDTQDALLEYPRLTASWSHREAASGGNRSSPLEFNGTKGSLSITRSGFAIVADRKVRPENMVPQFTDRQPVGGVKRIPQTGPAEFWTTAVDDQSGSGDEQFASHVRNFLDCIKSRQQPISELESGHQVATACHLANIALRVGRKVRWDAVRVDHGRSRGQRPAAALSRSGTANCNRWA
jgi:predicted dehydrogenase